MKVKVTEQALQPLPMSMPGACTHSRMISYRVLVEEHKAGKVHCVECGSVIPDPHLQCESKGV